MLLNNIFGYTRIDILTDPRILLNNKRIDEALHVVNLLRRGKPIEYIFGKTKFLDRDIFLNNSVLIPRPETEELVMMLIRESKGRKFFLDIGSGSGVIGISILLSLKDSFVYFNDISDEAFKSIEKNVSYYHLENRCIFLNGDFKHISEDIFDKIEVVVSNPPYVPFDEIYLLDDGSYYEPTNAIFVSNPEKIYFDIVKKFFGKKIYFEINPSLSPKLKTLGKIVKDINGKDRFLIVG